MRAYFYTEEWWGETGSSSSACNYKHSARSSLVQSHCSCCEVHVQYCTVHRIKEEKMFNCTYRLISSSIDLSLLGYTRSVAGKILCVLQGVLYGRT